jgi:hypothetical protein
VSRKERRKEKERQEQLLQARPQGQYPAGPRYYNQGMPPQGNYPNYGPPMPPAGAPVAQAPVRFKTRWRRINNNGPVPVAPPADFIQLTPIVQPIPLVPYSTQMQPLATFDEEYDDFDDFY